MVSGSQSFGGSPTFAVSANYAGSGGLPFGVSLNTSGLTCTTVGTATPISPTLTVGTYTLVALSCSGATLTGVNAADYTVVYTSAANDFTVNVAPLDVAVSGTQTYGGTPSFMGADSPPSGVTVNSSGLNCTQEGASTTIGPTLKVALYTLVAASCSGVTLSGATAADYSVVYTSAANDFTVTPAPLTITASNVAMTYGGSVPPVVAVYAGFVNGDGPSKLTTPPTCSTAATSSSPVSGSPYPSTCSGAVDQNYTISYVTGLVTVGTATLTITASSPTVTYGSVPTITPSYSGFAGGDNASSLTTPPTCSTTATSSSPASGSPYPSTCSGACGSQLRHRLRGRCGDGQARTADHHRLERLHDLRRDGACHHAALLWLRNRPQRLVPDDAAHVLDHRNQLEPCLGRAVMCRRVAGPPHPTTPSPT